jgi:hypothetical protein
MPQKKSAAKTAKRTTSARKTAPAFSAEERAAMKERAREAKAGESREEGEREVRAKIAEMPQPDRGMAERLHELVSNTAPDLVPRTWYGMPAYARDGKVVCFFKPAHKFKSRYATWGFEEAANLDDGSMWPTSYALTELTAADEKKLAALVKKAAR